LALERLLAQIFSRKLSRGQLGTYIPLNLECIPLGSICNGYSRKIVKYYDDSGHSWVSTFITEYNILMHNLFVVL